MKKMIFALLAAAVIIVTWTFCAYAQVFTTTEATNGDCIYIAGNPDMYPIEYYDPKDKLYKGILPDLFEQISKRGGINFSYVNASSSNIQDRLAKNNQVEIVSAHVRGDVDFLSDEVHIVTLENEGKQIDICIGFTSIASDQLKDTVISSIDSLSGEGMTRLAIENASTVHTSDFSFWMLFMTIELSILIFLLFLSILKRHNTQRQALEYELADTMTGIGNSSYFEYRYQNFISPASGTLYYIAYIGVDIKHIVQYYDAALSDELQIAAAGEISEEATERDFCARVSDGRFALAFEAPTIEFAKEKLEKLLLRLNGLNSEISVRFQAGLYHLESSGISCKQALFNARQGYYSARESNELYVTSDRELLKHEEYVLGLKKKLWRAIENKEFRLYTQYIFTGDGKKACGAEALSRWENPEEGTVFPKDYIEMLRTAGMIEDLDFYILEECCITLSKWREDEKRNLWLSCNMTEQTLAKDNFSDRFNSIINKYDFNRNNLVLEITEDAFTNNDEQVIGNIEFCKKAGCRIALDDFGLGCSSFKDLVYYPIDIIKIDKQIVEKSKTERGNHLLVGIICLAHFLNIKALCEGVEDENELNNSIKAECDYIQGFLLARTIPVDEASSDRDITFLQQ